MVPTLFLAAGEFDETLLFKIGEATLHCGFPIRRVMYDFIGAAARMLTDVMEYGIEFLFRRD